MKLRLPLCIFGLLLLTACATTQAPQVPLADSVPPSNLKEYRLGVGDVVSVRVYGGEEEMRFDRVRVNDPGVLTLAFGEFKLLGRTTREIETAITDSVKGRLFVNPRVWVNIEEYRPFFVQGQVARPGAYPFQPGLNVVKAVTIAGGFGPRASTGKIFVVREHDGPARRLKADLGTAIGPGDTITVEESFF